MGVIHTSACIPPVHNRVKNFRRTLRPEEKTRHMANHISSLKRARQTEKKTAVNRANKSKLRGTLRSLREALATGDATTATAQYRATVSILDKGVQKGTLHKNTASRYKSRLNARLKAVGTAPAATTKAKAKAKPAAKKAVAKKTAKA